MSTTVLAVALRSSWGIILAAGVPPVAVLVAAVVVALAVLFVLRSRRARSASS